MGNTAFILPAMDEVVDDAVGPHDGCKGHKVNLEPHEGMVFSARGVSVIERISGEAVLAPYSDLLRSSLAHVLVQLLDDGARV